MIKNKLILLSAIFVVIWSSGFIVGRMIVGVVSPNIFLGMRFLATSLLFFILSILYHKKYPNNIHEIFKHILIGVLCNGLYLGGSYWAISHGMPAGIMALLGGFQPLLTLIIVSLLFKEKFSYKSLFGIVLGLLGVYLAIPKSSILVGGNYNYFVVFISLLSILSITIGVIIQKYYTKNSELIPSLAIQNISGFFIAFLLVLVLGENLITFNFNLFFSLFWAVFILSGAGIYLLMYLTKQNGSVKTTSLLLLCPPLAAIQANLLFGETLSLLQIFGFIIVLFGVFLSQ